MQTSDILKITVTEKAADKVKLTLEKHNKKDGALRIFVRGEGGCCSGYQYGLAIDEKRDSDHVIETQGIRILVDPESAQYLQGSQVDYVESVMGEGFMVNNPNAAETCECGHSFKPK